MTLISFQNSILKPLLAIITVMGIMACSGGQADEPKGDDVSNEAGEHVEATSSVPTTSAPATSVPTAARASKTANSQDTVEIDPIAEGKKVFRTCTTCHTIEKDKRHRIGPNLWNIAGSTAGTRDGFKYSKAMADSAIVWDDANLDAFLENPRKIIPNNRMAFGGVRNAEKRSYLIEYMKTYTEE